MKLICPPDAWKNAVEIDNDDCGLLQKVASWLNIDCKYDPETDKFYLGNGANSDKKREQDTPAVRNDNVLRFVMRLPKKSKNQIIDGVIMLNGEQYKACSGAPGYQVYDEYWITAASPIPPGMEYEVDLKWSYSDLAGIAGRFYHILPDPIRSTDGSGRVRTEIGLHQDKASPGTSGCIGVVGDDWRRLCDVLDKIARTTNRVKLEVIYICLD